MNRIYDFRRWFFAVLVCILTISLLGCAAEPPFKQVQESIERIELVEVIRGEETLRCILTGTKIDQFMDKLHEMTCYKHLSPQAELGQYQIRIYYSNGETDIIGSTANAYTENSELVIHGWYFYKEEDLRELFAVYEWKSNGSPKGKSDTD